LTDTGTACILSTLPDGSLVVFFRKMFFDN